MIIFANNFSKSRKQHNTKVMKIVILDGYTAQPGDLSWQALEELGTLTVYDRTQPHETVTRAADADIVLTNKVVISREVMEQLPKLRYIGVLATGYNVVDIQAASERGITVTNVPAYSTESVAQMVFAHLLTVTNRQSRGTMEPQPRLLLLGLPPHRTRWQDVRHCGPGKYRTARGTDSPRLRHEGESHE